MAARDAVDYACSLYRYERQHRRCDRIVLVLAVVTVPLILWGVL